MLMIVEIQPLIGANGDPEASWAVLADGRGLRVPLIPAEVTEGAVTAAMLGLPASHPLVRRSKAIADFMFVAQYREYLGRTRTAIAAAYPGQETRIDPDIALANIALRDAALELEASRPA